MPSRRNAIEMTPEEIEVYLAEGQKTLNVATIGPSGHPHLVAMWFAMKGPNPVFWTFGKSQKIVNLRRNPKMSALVETGDTYNELKGVELVGTGRIVDDYDGIMEIAKLVAPRYNGPSALSEAAMPFIEAQARKRLGVELVVERVVSWDHTKLGGGY